MRRRERTGVSDAGDGGPVRFRWGAVTDVGRVRPVNQDRLLAKDGLFVVADGMGGHQGGEIASQLAIEAIGAHFQEPAIGSLVRSVREANVRVLAEAAVHPELAGMGTTLCALALIEVEPLEPTTPVPVVGAAAVDPPGGATVAGDDPVPGTGGDPEPPVAELRLAVVNVGDSRIYRVSGDELAQVTEDHSLVEELVRSGRLSPDEADGHPQRNILTRALGVGPDLQVDVWELPLVAGERFVLCSDGLFNEVTEAQIAATLRRLDDPEHAAAELVRLANEQGSRDNVTVIVVNVDHGGSGPTEPLPAAPAVIDLAGFATAGNGAEPAAGTIASQHRRATRLRDRRRARRRDHPVEPAGRRFGLGTALFVVVVLVVLAVGAVAIGVYARDNYFVSVDGDELVVFQGRPGGVLWFDPTVAERSGIRVDELTPALVEEVRAEPQYGTRQEALAYLDALAARIPGPEPTPTPRPRPTPTAAPTTTPAPSPTPSPRPTPTSIAAGGPGPA